MFDLEQAISDWRAEMSARALSRAVVDELESHLRDEIETRLRSGMAEREAFETAIKGIGEVDVLKREFASMDSRLTDVVVSGTVVLYSLVAGVPALFRLGSFADATAAQQLSSLAALAVTAALIFSGRLFIRMFPVISDQRVRMAIYGAGGLALLVWLVLFYHYVMTNAEWDMSKLVVAILWAWTPLAALCGMILGVENTARNDMRRSHV